MILTVEQFWCPVHGRLPQSEGEALVYDEAGGGPYIPFYKVVHRGCGQRGDYVCSGDTKACRLDGDFCVFHCCSVGREPHPLGVEHSRERSRATLASERQASEYESDGDRIAEVEGGGIFASKRPW